MFVKFNQSGIANIKVNDQYKISHIVGTREWCVERNGQVVKICDTKREAQDYINR